MSDYKSTAADLSGDSGMNPESSRRLIMATLLPLVGDMDIAANISWSAEAGLMGHLRGCPLLTDLDRRTHVSRRAEALDVALVLGRIMRRQVDQAWVDMELPMAYATDAVERAWSYRRVETCHQCGTPILWAVGPTGCGIPVDLEATPGGTIRLVLQGGTAHAQTVRVGSEVPLWAGHLPTCNGKPRVVQRSL